MTDTVSSSTDWRVKAILDREASDMGRAVELVDSAILKEDIVTVVYRCAPMTRLSGGAMQETRVTTWIGGQPSYSTVVKTEWIDD